MPNGTRELQSGASSAMSYIMDPSARDWSKGSLRGSSAPFSPDTDGDVDGDPVQPSVDLELARKKKELEVIQEKIARKKAVLATRQLKHGAKDMPKKQTASTTVKSIAKQTKINNTIFKTYNQVTDKSSRVCLPLKRRVLDILRKFRRTPVRHLLRKTKKQNKMRALELMISAPLENEEAHPLRLRVKGLMNQRRSPNNEVVPDDKQHNPTIQTPVHSLRTQEKDIAATGFQRFLNVLNEGVDLNKLSKIVNDENEILVVGEELPQVWPTLLEGHVDSSSRSKSSPVEEKKVRLEDEQRYEQMQTLLEIVGLDLGVEELGRLTDRTNDRLYGKMGDLKRKEFENEKGKEKKESEPSFKHLSTSSLPSDSASPLLNQHSNMTVEYSSSSNRVWDIERDRSERDWHRHSGTREKDREREEDIVREMERSERDGHREDRAREGDSPTRERSRQRCSSTRDKDRVRERDRSERNRKGDGHRHSSTREGDKDIPTCARVASSEPGVSAQLRHLGRMDPEKHSHQREYREPKACSQRREYEEPERYSRRREYGGLSSGQWDDSLEKRGNGQAMPREPYSEYSSMRRTREGGKEYGASSAMSHIIYPSSRDWSKGSLRGSSGPFSPDTDRDVDGDPVELSVEDLELARKKKELQVIEEKIARKKAVLALQKVKRRAKDMPETQAASATAKGMSKQRKVSDTTFQRYSNVADQSSRICLPLKRRVLDILSKLRRTPVRYLLRKDTPAKLKKQNKMRALELMISAPLENEEAHPLRLRVKGLMNQRRSPNNEVVANDKQHNPTIQRPVHSLRTQEKDIAATGFQRFLNVLNEGVDLNKLSKIVNDENELLIVGEELPQVWPTLLEGHVDYSSRSKSSPFEEKKVRLEDEQRYERMQTLLEIVGLDLGVEELGRLTDRTNDRLYGKMGDLKRDRAREGESPAREGCRQRCSSTRDKDRVRERDRSERNRKGDGHRHSSTRESDKDIPVVRETNRSERNRDKDGDRDPEKDWDGGRERDRDRSRRDGGRYRSERDGDRDPEKAETEAERKTGTK
ncbi:unnamed protein product [Oncorhynchus mykiss]|uniref:Uncharacterized protein n=1 Tax=Oncorhynchus mykiss TaxID=8022 RepID=A0A060WYQ5_ONCMY|nr:unnamed protein product [Oncorhynchus mykiss]